MNRDGQPYISPNSPWPPPKLPFPFWVSPQLDRRENRPFLFKHLCGAHSAAVVERRSRSGRDVSTCFRSIPFPFTLSRTAHPTRMRILSEHRESKDSPPMFFSCFNFDYLLCVHTLAHSFALFCTLQKLKSFHFKRFRTLCQKYRGWGYPPSLEEEQNENSNCRFRRSIPSLATSHFRRTSGRFGEDGGKEGASARKNHWMGCREVTGCNSFQPWSASWT